MIKNYIPRHERIGVNLEVAPFEITRDVTQSVPVLDSNNRPLMSYQRNVEVSAYEDMAKFKPEDFDLEAMIENGVKLDLINVDRSQLHSIDEIEAISSKLTSLEDYASKLQRQREEQNSWFSSASSSSNVELPSVKSTNNG